MLPAVVIGACTTFGVLPNVDGGTEPSADGGAPTDASLADGGPPSTDGGRGSSFCGRKPADAVFCADFEPGGAGLSAFDEELRSGDGALRRIVEDENKNFAVEVTGELASGPRLRKTLPPIAGYRLGFRVQVRATGGRCDYLAFGGFFSTYDTKAEGGYLFGAALYAPSTPFSLSGRKYSPAGVLQNLQPGSRWYDISVEIRPPLAANTRVTVVRIDGKEAADQTSDDPGDASRNVLALELGRIFPSNCGPVSLRFDDVLVVPAR